MRDVVKILNNDGVIIFPTDTVWGVGAALHSSQAIQRLYQIKQRDPQKPTGIFVRDMEMAKEYGIMSEQAEDLASKHWPGQLSIVVKSTEKVPAEIQGPNQTVSMRIPNHPTTAHLLLLLNQPLVQTSANFSGQPTPTKFEMISPELLALVDHTIEGGCVNDQPSTIVDATGDQLIVLRQGAIHIQ